jgi:hypothetical protein
MEHLVRDPDLDAVGRLGKDTVELSSRAKVDGGTNDWRHSLMHPCA